MRNVSDLIESAANKVGGIRMLAALLGVSYQAIRKWQKKGCMPRTEWTGETHYCETIERVTNGGISQDALKVRERRKGERRSAA